LQLEEEGSLEKKQPGTSQMKKAYTHWRLSLLIMYVRLIDVYRQIVESDRYDWKAAEAWPGLFLTARIVF
jgi:hypothetical protein